MKVRIDLEDNETSEQADELLLKALKAKEEDSLKHTEFADPEMEKEANKLKALISKHEQELLDNLISALEGKQ